MVKGWIRIGIGGADLLWRLGLERMVYERLNLAKARMKMVRQRRERVVVKGLSVRGDIVGFGGRLSISRWAVNVVMLYPGLRIDGSSSVCLDSSGVGFQRQSLDLNVRG